VLLFLESARDTRGWRERRDKQDGCEFEVRGFGNFEPRTSNHKLRVARLRTFQHPAYQ
jgi:hypothetical protein